MTSAQPLDRGRDAFRRRAWTEAKDAFATAAAAGPIPPEDLERFATVRYLLGEELESDELWVAAHHGWLERGEDERAAGSAFWLGLGLVNRGDMAPAGGWFARAARLVENRECVQAGYLLVTDALHRMGSGDPASAYDRFGEALAIARRCPDADLETLGRLGQGQSLVMQGKRDAGLALLDEAMVAVTTSEASPIVAGIVYCAVIDACHRSLDLRRAKEWTGALSTWCASQPDMVPYRGQCLIHRSQILQMQGAWADATEEALRACDRLEHPSVQPAVGAAYYQRGELHRLRGEFADADEAFTEAGRVGYPPMPGLALLRLAQGRIDAAVTSIVRANDGAGDPGTRSRMLAATVEIMLAADDRPAAEAAADELARIADAIDASMLRAISDHATGSVKLAEGDADTAATAARRSSAAWRELDVPYEAARARVLAAKAFDALGDHDAARMEREGARAAFEELGAATDLAQIDDRPTAVAGLTGREIQVLRLVAAGKTNRVVSRQLSISEKTVARHVSNIFTKIGVSSRAAATAYAYEHDLIRTST